MLRRHRLLVQRLLVYIDIGLVFLTYATGVKGRKFFLEPGELFARDEFLHLSMIGLALILIIGGYKAVGLYRSQRMGSIWGEAGRILGVNLLSFLVLVLLATGLLLHKANFVHLIIFHVLNAGAGISLRIAIRTVARLARRKGYNYRNLVVVANPGHGPNALLSKVESHDYWGYRVLAVVLPPGVDAPDWDGAHLPGKPPILSFGEVIDYLKEHPCDEVWVDGLPDNSGKMYELTGAASDQGVQLRYVMPDNYFQGVRWGFDSFDGITTLSAAHTPMGDLQRVVKRSFDVTCAGLILVLTSPVLLLVWLLIKGERNGPVLFRQTRVGLNGREFTLYKFRTMVPNAEALRKELEAQNELAGPVFKIKKDPRITPVGVWLRKFSLDELPQLFNVLKGQMSLVGPRPPIPSEVDLYERRQRRRLSVKPGITGLWQVSGRNEIDDFDEWVKLDLEYIDKWSLLLDLKILFKTVPTVFMARGAS